MVNRNPEVDQYLSQKGHPLTPEIQRVREIILETHPKVQETIKWSSPTFMYKGNIASFFMNAKKMVSLMFHKGALIKDTHGLLQGDGKEARTARFADLPDIEAKKAALQAVIMEWMAMKDSE